MKVYHVWLDKQKLSTEHLVKVSDTSVYGWQVRIHAARHYGKKSVNMVARRVDDIPGEVTKLESYLGYADYMN